MPSYTSRLGLRYPVSSDPANPPNDFQLLATALDGASVVYYAAISSSPPASPVNGSIWYQTDTRDFYVWAATAWRTINVHFGNASGGNYKPPISPTTFDGSLWFQTDTQQLTVYSNSQAAWVPVTAATLAATAPTTPSGGQLWYDTTNKGLKVNNAGTWENAQQVNPYLLCHKGANQSLSAVTNTTITFGTVDISLGNNAPTNNNGIITINQSGLYHIDFAASTTTGSVPYLYSQIVTTSSTYGSISYRGSLGANGSNEWSATNTNVTIPFVNGDSFVCQVAAQSSTTLQGGQGTLYCMTAYLGPIS